MLALGRDRRRPSADAGGPHALQSAHRTGLCNRQNYRGAPPKNSRRCTALLSARFCIEQRHGPARLFGAARTRRSDPAALWRQMPRRIASHRRRRRAWYRIVHRLRRATARCRALRRRAPPPTRHAKTLCSRAPKKGCAPARNIERGTPSEILAVAQPFFAGRSHRICEQRQLVPRASSSQRRACAHIAELPLYSEHARKLMSHRDRAQRARRRIGAPTQASIGGRQSTTPRTCGAVHLRRSRRARSSSAAFKLTVLHRRID